MSLKVNKISILPDANLIKVSDPSSKTFPIALASSALGVRPAHFIDASAAYDSIQPPVPTLESWSPPPSPIQLWGPVFNIQEKITVHFHTQYALCTRTRVRVYIGQLKLYTLANTNTNPNTNPNPNPNVHKPNVTLT